MEVKDRNGLSYKVAGLPQMASGQQRENLLRVLPDHVQQGQRFCQFTIYSAVKFPDGGTLFKRFNQVGIELGHEVGNDFIGGCCHSLLQKMQAKKNRWAAACGGEE